VRDVAGSQLSRWRNSRARRQVSNLSVVQRVGLRTIILTNQSWPSHSVHGYSSLAEAEKNGVLKCQEEFVNFRSPRKAQSEALVRLQRHECDIRIPDVQSIMDLCGANTKQKWTDVAGRNSNLETGPSEVFRLDKKARFLR
jgi:hypothetical protein